MTATAMPFDTLFAPDFLAALSHLTLNVKRVAPAGRHGERLSRDLGSGLEFRDFRPYTPGDDIRRIDWNIYRRLHKVFLRVHEEEQDLPLYLMPDLSASMFLEPVPRAWTALRCTLALAAIGLQHHDSAEVFPFAEQIQQQLERRSGRTSIMMLAQRLAQLAPTDRAHTNLAESMQRIATMRLRRGLLVVISDFFDAAGLDQVREVLRQMRHRVWLVQLVRPSDAAPDVRGDVRLRDCETGSATEVTVTTSVLARYRQVYERFNRDLGSLAEHLGGGLLQVDCDADLIPQLHEALSPGRLRA